MYYISDYRENNKFTGIYLCKQKQILKTKAGKTYYSLILQDKTGTIDAKIWDLNNAINEFESMDYIACEGLVTSFQGNLQVNISRVRVADEGEYDPTDYIPCTDRDIDEMYDAILKFTDSVKNTYLHKLLCTYFKDDTSFIKEFKAHSAAKSVHHAFLGGLLQHTLAVTGAVRLILRLQVRLRISFTGRLRICKRRRRALALILNSAKRLPQIC